ncbi:hypothetical protein G6F65_022638 [Rhizopus arrhizus]|nr:hypothetical protein G6F65_022638 [Rhizopus arrhizus]
MRGWPVPQPAGWRPTRRFPHSSPPAVAGAPACRCGSPALRRAPHTRRWAAAAPARGQSHFSPAAPAPKWS